jgi:cytochrome c-type biogenesis protein CcmH/NrfF
VFEPQNLGGTIVTMVTTPFIAILLVIIIVLVRSLRRATASTRWRATDGRVLSSGVNSHYGMHHTMTFEPQVVYEYQSGGQLYHGERVSFGVTAGTSSPDWADRVVARYPPGSSVQVFYDPASPSEAVLEHSGAMGLKILTTVLTAVELLLVALVVLGLTGHLG